MMYKYCPDCFSLDLKFNMDARNHTCNMCGRKGEVKEDSIDRINTYRKQGTSMDMNFKESKMEAGLNRNEENLVSIDQKIKNKFGDKSKNSDWELL